MPFSTNKALIKAHSRNTLFNLNIKYSSIIAAQIITLEYINLTAFANQDVQVLFLGNWSQWINIENTGKHYVSDLIVETKKDKTVSIQTFWHGML